MVTSNEDFNCFWCGRIFFVAMVTTVCCDFVFKRLTGCSSCRIFKFDIKVHYGKMKTPIVFFLCVGEVIVVCEPSAGCGSSQINFKIGIFINCYGSTTFYCSKKKSSCTSNKSRGAYLSIHVQFINANI